MSAIRVLGIDPGLTRCGLGVIEGPVSRPTTVAVDVIRTDRESPVHVRLSRLHDAVAAAISRHRPDVVACERVLFSVNTRTAMAVGQAAGVALLAAAQAGVAVASYSPNEVKLCVAGHGGATKDAVGRMVAAQLRLGDVPEPADAADALAVALCHLARGGFAAAVDGDGSTSPTAATGSGGWEAVLDRPHIRVAGGTSPADRGGQR